MLPYQQSYDLGFGTPRGFQIQDIDPGFVTPRRFPIQDYPGFGTPQGFPIQDDPGFGNPCGFQIQDDLIGDYDFLENNMIDFSVENSMIDFSAGKNVKEVSKTTDLTSKKDVHREIERKRRKELSDLYASLRSHLPHHKIKGKQSVCDHVQAATSHIIRMEKKIRELEIRRNKLKSWANKSTDDVDVNMVSDGIIEILVSNSVDDNLGLSRVFAELQRNELDVVSSVSTRTKDRFVHKIQAEALGMANLGALELQNRLSKAIK